MPLSVLFIKKNDKYVKVMANDILFVSAQGSYLLVVSNQDQFSIALNLSQFVRRYDLPMLMRVHRSYLANINKVHSFDHSYLYIDSHQIPIGDSYRQKIMGTMRCL